MRVSLARLAGSRVLAAGAKLATCLVLVAMSIQMAPPAAMAKAPTTKQPSPEGPTMASLLDKPVPTEVPSLRTAYSDTYDNHDGTFTASVSTGPINYKPSGSSSYQPIDTTLAAMAGRNGRMRASKTATPVEIGAPDDAAGFLSFDTGHGTIALHLAPGAKPGKAGSKPSATGSRANVAGLLPNIDLEADATNTGVETFFRDERDPSPRSRRVFSFHRFDPVIGDTLSGVIGDTLIQGYSRL